MDDVTQAFKDAENVLRDFAAEMLEKRFGTDWMEECGISGQTVEEWRKHKSAEQVRQFSGSVEPRLLYYSSLDDLLTIFNKNWALFADALGDQATITVYLKELKRLRDPDAHRRELLPHQKNLIAGIAGEIRTRIVRYRSQQDTPDAYFPRVESARDSLGNVYIPGETRSPVFTKHILRPGSVVDLVVTATDPYGGPLFYQLVLNGVDRSEWQEINSFSVRVLEAHIGRNFSVGIHVRSARDYHAASSYDDKAEFVYTVFPHKQL
jgi:hypothetical protein